MKKITQLALLLCIGFSGAQTTYNATDFAAVGESFFITTAGGDFVTLDYVQTGASFNWDYSLLEPASQDNTSYINPNNAGYKTVWCFQNGYIINCNTQFNNNFTHATAVTDGLVLQGLGLTNVVDHLKLSAAALENKMIGAQVTANGVTLPFTASYQTPDKLYQFPINYGDNYTNNSALSLNLTSLGIPLTLSQTGIRTNLVDGWGSLTTPFGSFANVLRMKTTFVSNITITMSDQTPQQQTITTVTYSWFDPAYGIPVLEVDGQEIASQFVPTAVRYMDIQRCLDANALFVPFPPVADFDPATGNAAVTFINTSTNYDVVSWDFGDGTAVSTNENPSHVFTCPGIREVTLTVTNQFCDPDNVDTITIPVTITDSQNAFTTAVTVTSTTLTADRDLTGTTYQWLDCNAGNQPIAGATSQTFTPTQDGNYAVQLTTNGCVSVSDCYTFATLGNGEFSATDFSIIPNPTTGEFIIQSDAEIKSIAVYNLLGELVSSKADLSGQASGIYLLKIVSDKGVFCTKICKE